MAVISTTPKAYQLRHPEHDVIIMAEVVGHWRQSGRWIGFRLRFAGEDAARCLTFAEIRNLQEDTADTAV